MDRRILDETGLPERLAARGLSRRDFLKALSLAAAAVGLPATAVPDLARAVTAKARPSVIWLHFQECTGCTESLLRASHPALAELLLDLISLDYHETLFAAAGHQAEAALHANMEAHAGKYVLVIEGAIPTADGGIHCKIGGKTALELCREVAAKAGAILSIGSCASFGGVAAAEPNPTGAKGVPTILEGKTVVTLPGCPPNPYNLLGVVLQYATFGTLPALDAKGRPLFAYARTIHEDCPRRPHFDAGRFAEKFGDAGHRAGHCLYQLGCKGPQTHAACSIQHFCDVVGAWPVGIGHPCIGCTEQELAFRVPLHDTVPIFRPTPPDTYPPVAAAPRGEVSPIATGVAGLVGGALIGAAALGAKRLSRQAKDEESSEEERG